jgi:hypothetical protein
MIDERFRSPLRDHPPFDTAMEVPDSVFLVHSWGIRGWLYRRRQARIEREGSSVGPWRRRAARLRRLTADG